MINKTIIFKFLAISFCVLLFGCPNTNIAGDMDRYGGNSSSDGKGPVDSGTPVTVKYDLNLSYATGTLPAVPADLKSGDTYQVDFPDDIKAGTTAYKFVGWSTVKSGFSDDQFFSKDGNTSLTLDRDTTFYAQYEGLWKAGVIGYNGDVTYDASTAKNFINTTYVATFTGNETGFYDSYGTNKTRIPTLFTLPNGDLLAFSDKRYGNGDIAGPDSKLITVAKWSHDNGTNWSSPVEVFPHKSELNGANSRGDAGVVYDRINDKIVVLAVGHRGLWYGKTGETSKIWMIRGSVKYGDDGHINGFDWENERDITGYFFGDMDSDVGKCTDPVRSKYYAGFVASGNGVQLQTGPKAGRLLFSIAIRRAPWKSNNATTGGGLINYAIYSDDGGTTWSVSDNSPTTGDGSDTGGYGDEASIAELPDGKLLMAVRPSGAKGGDYQKMLSYSNDYGKSWTTAEKNSKNQLPSSQSVGGVLMYTTKSAGWEKDILIGVWDALDYGTGTSTNGFNNGVVTSYGDASKKVSGVAKRQNPGFSTVFVSYDNGENWFGRNYYVGDSGYSSFTILRDGSIGILVEDGGWGGSNLRFYRLTLDWVTDGSTEGAYRPKRVN